jgi:hypothetical protein
MRFKTWLRGAADGEEPVVEVIGESAWYERSGHGKREQRSIMAELLTEREVQKLEVSEGLWLLPGPPP